MPAWDLISDAMDNALLSRMQSLCSRREYCTGDILAKLKDSPDREEIIESLRKDNYLNDSRYAAAFVRDKSSLQGWGPVKIRHSLTMKGMSKTVIDAAFEEMDETKAEEKLTKTLALKYKSLQEDPDCRLKLIRFALGRGYEWEAVAPVIDRIISDGKI